jgi:hypothetical protein
MIRHLAPALAGLMVALTGMAARGAGSDLEFYTGADLSAQCSAAASDADFQSRQARCQGYVLGVSDVLQAQQGAGSPARVCLQPSNDAPALTDAVRRFLSAHTEKHQLAAQDLVIEALAEAFPCK